jgi:subtilase family serine protease
MHFWPRLSTLLVVLLVTLAGCSTGSSSSETMSTTTPTSGPRPTQQSTPSLFDLCPTQLASVKNCYTPHSLRVAYDIEALTQRGFTGKGQTIIDIVSYGSPTLQKDMDIFDKQFGLPPITIQVISPLGTTSSKANTGEMLGWAEETELDVQIMHAIAPDAKIIVMTSPVDETEGTIGLPEFMKLEQYAVTHHLGQIFSQSFVASEATLTDNAGQQLVTTYSKFYQQITTQEGWTIVSGSGDNGATDWNNIAANKLAPTRTVNFPADVPWVTAVGGTSLLHTSAGYNEVAWSRSGGGFSKFFSMPEYQKSLSQASQSLAAGQRGLPDVAADANPFTGMAFCFRGRWNMTGGTSASTPLWAGLVAIANQMAGHPLGFINPGIYKAATSAKTQQDFRDITEGNNNVNGTTQVKGFAATPGWDAVTGWGAPRTSQFIPDLITALK